MKKTKSKAGHILNLIILCFMSGFSFVNVVIAFFILISGIMSNLQWLINLGVMDIIFSMVVSSELNWSYINFTNKK